MSPTEQEDLALAKYVRAKEGLSEELFKRDNLLMKLKKLLEIVSDTSSGIISTLNIEKIKEIIEQLFEIEHNIRYKVQEINENAPICGKPTFRIHH